MIQMEHSFSETAITINAYADGYAIKFIIILVIMW